MMATITKMIPIVGFRPLVASHNAQRLKPLLSQQLSLLQTQNRMLTTEGKVTIQKLRTVFEEYRKENYTQCLPSRFWKTIINEAKKESNNSSAQAAIDDITWDGVWNVVHNIGGDKVMTEQEVKTLFEELLEEENSGKKVTAKQIFGA